MNFLEELKLSFESRSRPEIVVDDERLSVSDNEDALWFSGRDWQEISRLDWETHKDAFYTLSPEAFAYFLPSIFKITLEDPGKYFELADIFIGILDRMPIPAYWDDFLLTRMVRFTAKECALMSYWLLDVASLCDAYDSSSINRAFDTMQLLEREVSIQRPLSS